MNPSTQRRDGDAELRARQVERQPPSAPTAAVRAPRLPAAAVDSSRLAVGGDERELGRDEEPGGEDQQEYGREAERGVDGGRRFMAGRPSVARARSNATGHR